MLLGNILGVSRLGTPSSGLALSDSLNRNNECLRLETHLIQHGTQPGALTIVYDGDGNRVSETVAGVNTLYLVDTQNPTGYAQVVDEIQNGSVVCSSTKARFQNLAVDLAWFHQPSIRSPDFRP